MTALKLVIGNKTFSSWSLRPWIVMKQFEIPFDEQRIVLRQPDTKQQILKQSPSGKIPVLVDGDLAVSDSLAICEYLADRYPDKALWPQDRTVRAKARSVVAEMHSGFPDMRNELNMDILARLPHPALSDGCKTDVARVQTIWRDALTASGGPFLFGDFTIADAFYVPVATRFRSYSIPLDAELQAYADRLLTLPAMQEWEQGAERE